MHPEKPYDPGPRGVDRGNKLELMSFFRFKNLLLIRLKRLLARLPFLPVFVNWMGCLAGMTGTDEERAALTNLQDLALVLCASPPSRGEKGTVVVFGQGRVDFVVLESFLVQCFRKAGYRPVVLTGLSPLVQRAYEAVGVKKIEYLSKYCIAPPLGLAQRLIGGVEDFPEFVNMRLNDIRVGKYTASTVMRKTRMGYLPLEEPDVRAKVLRQLETSIAYVEGARKLVQDFGRGVLRCIYPEWHSMLYLECSA